MKNEINRIAGRLVKAFNTNTVINPIPVKYCKNINLANKLRKLCEDQIKDETRKQPMKYGGMSPLF